ncbi:MAG TPA: glycosyltransferase [Gammaproteobacteria bacterium]|nr:glycosyltransferase [Gammaproteobacteria bacterium]
MVTVAWFAAPVMVTTDADLVTHDMKLLFLTKRRPQGKDLMTRPYGRFYYLPRELAELGHTVTVVMLSHQFCPPSHRQHEGIEWISESLLPWGPWSYWKRLRSLIQAQKPDWIIGCSDTYYGILANYWAARSGAKSLLDAYDNFESYLPWVLPLHGFWRTALRRADAITAAGPDLGKLMAAVRIGQDYSVIPMAADPGFQPMDRNRCRQQFEFLPNKKYVGYSGALSRRRDLSSLFALIDRFANDPDIEFVLSGRKGAGIVLPEHCRWLGYLQDGRMPVLLNALDVVLVLNKTGAFGNFSYPVKLYEAMACQRPVVVSDLPSTGWIMRDHRQFLSPAGDVAAAAAKIKQFLVLRQYDYGISAGWKDNAKRLLQVLSAASVVNDQ